MSTKDLEQLVWRLMQAKEILEGIEYHVYMLVKAELHRRAVEEAEDKLRRGDGRG